METISLRRAFGGTIHKTGKFIAELYQLRYPTVVHLFLETVAQLGPGD